MGISSGSLFLLNRRDVMTIGECTLTVYHEKVYMPQLPYYCWMDFPNIFTPNDIL